MPNQNGSFQDGGGVFDVATILQDTLDRVSAQADEAEQNADLAGQIADAQARVAAAPANPGQFGGDDGSGDDGSGDDGSSDDDSDASGLEIEGLFDGLLGSVSHMLPGGGGGGLPNPLAMLGGLFGTQGVPGAAPRKGQPAQGFQLPNPLGAFLAPVKLLAQPSQNYQQGYPQKGPPSRPMYRDDDDARGGDFSDDGGNGADAMGQGMLDDDTSAEDALDG